MRTVSATEAKQRFAAILDAAQHEPIMVRRQKREVAVVLSPRDYERLRALNLRELDEYCQRIGAQAAERGLTEEKLAEILDDAGGEADRR
ncbi:MAG: type II toxin-antitoxin system Phd/YefM family antitoxin [Holophagales bacterium]|nr:type II toxin-antitoxin system Phd/YefM family antitoxin [Holophagales bacterium]MYF94423.1 type II toxin-antitoxin system Phd/YefM family antitoxin [Holophagales bacterium]